MKDPQHQRPIWLGVMIATAAPTVVILCMALSHSASAVSLDMMAADAVVAIAFSLPVSLLAMLTLGLPYILVLKSFGLLNAITVCSGAAVIGAIAGCAFIAVISDKPALSTETMIFGATIGLIAGAAFCAGAGPNRSFKSKLLRSST